MATLFSSIATRSNGQRILYSWFESLKAAGVSLESYLGAGYIAETTFTFANNQTSATNVTGLTFSSSSYKSASIEIAYRRSGTSGANTAYGIAYLAAFYRDDTAAWDLVSSEMGDASGLTFSITAAGQVQYTSSDMGAAGYSGASRFKAATFGT